jgi:eukaryotic-like serine/threonine-protein kinase
MAPAQRFEPGERVAAKYRLRRLLATGGMGQVWVARNEATGADVALKVLRRSERLAGVERQLEERFRQEARLSAQLSHRSIVRVFDLVEEEGGALVLVMELLRGETLQHYLERLGSRPAGEAVAIMAPVLGALAHAHELGLVHRDVSPANIFLAVDPDGHVAPKLVDFGLAKPTGTASAVETVAGDVLGTPRYVAPERIRGASDVDGRADLFSAGVVLFEAITGVSPFAASSPSASLAAVLESTVDPDPCIDPRLWLELRRAMSKAAYERHASARELATALRDALVATDATLEATLQAIQPEVAPEPEDEGMPSPSTSAGVLATPAARARRVRAWLVLAAALGALLALAALALTRTARSGDVAPTAVSTIVASAAAPPPAPPPQAPTVPAPASSPEPSAPSSSVSHPKPAGRARPVATTPGF